MKKNPGSICLILLVSIIWLAASGCVDRGRLEAFLQKPRSPVAGVDYIVLPPDRISISSLRISEINNFQQQVRPDGKIVLPLLGDIEVAGKTTEEIEAEIIEASKEYYEEGDARVEVAAYLSQKYYVFGQVGRGGPRPWTGHDTLLDALAVSGPTSLSWPDRIRIIRARQPHYGGYLPSDEYEQGEVKDMYVAAGYTKTGAEEVMIDWKAMTERGDLSHNILLRPNDVIYVPPNPFAAVGLALQTILFPTRPVAEVIRLPYDYERLYNRDDYNNRYR